MPATVTIRSHQAPAKLLLAVTGLGHGQKGTARAILDEFARKGDDRASILDLDDFLTGSELFRAARRDAMVSESTLEKIRDHVMARTDGGIKAFAALDPVAAVLVSRAFAETPLAVVQCGIMPDSRWPVESAALAFVPDQAAAGQFLQRNMTPDRIVPLGLPLCPGFAPGVSTAQSEAAEQLGLDPDRPIVLLPAESLSPFSLAQTARILARPRGTLQVVLDMAGDWEAEEALQDDPTLAHSDIRLLGKTDLAPIWWASANLVVCHASDHIVSRALALGKPLVTLPPDRPSAIRVAKAVSERRLGLTTQRADEIPFMVSKALSLLPKFERTARQFRTGAAVRRMTTALQAFANQCQTSIPRDPALSSSHRPKTRHQNKADICIRRDN